MTIIALVRHGETEWNREGRVQGHSDIPLNDTGRAQAQGAAEALRGGDYARIVASPLLRARETAEIIGRAIGLTAPALYDGLKERGYGEAEGMHAAEYWERYPGGVDVPGAETNDEVLARALDTLARIAADGTPAIAVAHGGLISRVLRHASDGRYPRAGERIGNGSQQILDVTDDGIRVIGYSGT
ncbi:histidine phosphatase family protein [Microbacterium sp. G2-8]|uniref:histidine phosphatase family protein n=1 Tax=Microbacterium sp. G2-8 TaxID=2842454 RepID=UPI0027E33133|nr:histidine phosphatase family protein [Microbacterium sp. G2-8]